MKKIILICFFGLIVSTVFAQFQDSLFIYKSGIPITKFAFNQIDTITFKSESNIDSIFLYKGGQAIYKEDVSQIDSIFKGIINGSVIDIDGNVYSTVRIGTQMWMRQNLRVKTFNDGISIPIYKDSLPELELPGMLFYDNNEVNFASSYGALYNFYAVDKGRLCPAGWHVPSNNDINILSNSLGGYLVAGNKMKEVGLEHWESPNTGATNSSGFDALPAGIYINSNKSFSAMGMNSLWWSSTKTPFETIYAEKFELSSSDIILGFSNMGSLYKNALSVRCIKDKNIETKVPTISNFSNITKSVGDQEFQLNAFSNSSSPIIYSVIGGYGAEVSSSGKVTVVSSGTILINASVASNGVYTSNSKTILLKLKPSITVTDIDGNNYYGVRIGSQIWMQQNLQVTKYTDGTSIPLIVTDNDWTNLNGPGMSFYKNDKTTYGRTFGALYNWQVIRTEKLCPVGWHVPTSVEWTELITFLGPNNAGGKMKDAVVLYKESVFWNIPNVDATNSSDFTAIAAGFRNINSGYVNIGEVAGFWTSSLEGEYKNFVSTISLYRANSLQGGSVFNNMFGYSVRCIMNDNNNPIQTSIFDFEDISKNFDSYPFKITAKVNSTAAIIYSIKSGTAATITSNGLVTVSGPGIVEIKADVPAIGNYAATSKVITLIISSNKYVVIDVDENIYPVVQIGNQAWMAKNLRVTRLNNGNSISTELFNSYTEPKMAWYNDVVSNADVYGGLYNWATVGTNKLCPIGWHVPSNNDWSELEVYLGGKDAALPKLKLVSMDAFSNNQSGFNGTFAGVRGEYPTYYGAGISSGFWSSTKDNIYTSLSRNLGTPAFNSFPDFATISISLKSGLSVRCLKNNDGTSILMLTTIDLENILKREGDASFSLNATSNSSGLITYSIVSGTAASVTLNGLVTIIGTGVVTIKASVAETATNIYVSKNITLTINPADVTDTDGNVYKTISIGNQIWMAENLKTKSFNDGQLISVIEDQTLWMNSLVPAMCWYDNDKITYDATYGALYNYYAVQSEKLCPVGWAIPTESDFTVLKMYLGETTAGGSLKEVGSVNWSDPNITNNPNSGFKATPGGKRLSSGIYNALKVSSNYWTSSSSTFGPLYFKTFALSYKTTTFGMDLSAKTEGLSVRCIRK